MTSFVSLCSSAGGMDLGGLNAGLLPTASYEIDADACEVYERLTGHPVTQADLTRMNPHSIPDSDMIVGGPPCQEFSQGNVLGRIEGKKNLWATIIEIVRAKCPPVFVFENVKGLTTKRHAAYFNWILSEFQDMGYRVDWRILNAADYGVPQTRERVFITGRLDGKPWCWPRP